MIQKAGIYFVPVMLTVIAIILLTAQKDMFEAFTEGAREGLETCRSLIPILVLIITATGMFSASGAMTALCGFVSKIMGHTGFPTELFPLLVIRPLSGSGATATVNQLFSQYGADSFTGRCASIIMGASDTIVYTLAMYFGSVGITKTRHTFPAAFLTLLFCVVFSYYLTLIFF